jgi:hypothetical protein
MLVIRPGRALLSAQHAGFGHPILGACMVPEARVSMETAANLPPIYHSSGIARVRRSVVTNGKRLHVVRPGGTAWGATLPARFARLGTFAARTRSRCKFGILIFGFFITRHARLPHHIACWLSFRCRAASLPRGWRAGALPGREARVRSGAVRFTARRPRPSRRARCLVRGRPRRSGPAVGTRRPLQVRAILPFQQCDRAAREGP